MIVCRMVTALPTIRCRDGSDRPALRQFPGKAVEVTEGQGKVDGQGDQRKP